MHAARHRLGKLPAPSALFWVVPLVRLESNGYGTETLLRYHVTPRPATGGAAGGVHVAISRAPEAAAA